MDNEADNIPEGHYRCELCRGIFRKGWTDEDCITERIQNFGTQDIDDDAIVCDDCFQKIMPVIFN